jgi:hypothetical protein
MSPSDSCRAVGNLDDSQNNSLIFYSSLQVWTVLMFKQDDNSGWRYLLQMLLWSAVYY